MSKTKTTAGDDLARDEILHLPIGLIDADPKNPRVDVDADLAESIALHGVLQAIEVRPHPDTPERYMIVDGERRYRGSVKAGAKTLPCTITLEAEGEGRADRLIRQIVRNEGKPLTAMEEALAFEAIIDDRHASGDTKYGPSQLARDLGIPKSTVGDRLALTELAPCWLELMTADGPLQPSHAAILSKWKLVPEKYQREAIEQFKSDDRWPGASKHAHGAGGEKIYGERLETLLRTYMTKFVRPVSELPGYVGPTNRFAADSYSGVQSYAMDPDMWRPIHRGELAKKRTASGKAGAKTAKKNEQRTPAWVTAAREAGATMTADRQHFGVNYFRHDSALKGYTAIINRGEWHVDADVVFDPAVLVARLDLSKLIVVSALDYNSKREWYAGTKDDGALSRARTAHLEARTGEWESILLRTGSALVTKAEPDGRDAIVKGGYAVDLLGAFASLTDEWAEYLFAVAKAGGVDDIDTAKPKNVDQIKKWLAAATQRQAETIINCVAVMRRHKIPSPLDVIEAWETAKGAKYCALPVAFAVSASAAAPDPAPPAKAKRAKKTKAQTSAPVVDDPAAVETPVDAEEMDDDLAYAASAELGMDEED